MSQTERITLYAAVDSPFPHRVRLALEEAGAKYDTIWIDLIIDKPEWYQAKVNPRGVVPYLIYGGSELHPGDAPDPSTTQVSESLVILEYLADIFPSSGLLPASPALRAKARLFYLAVDTQFLKPFFTFIFLRAPLEALLGALEQMQTLLPPEEEGPFAIGKEWSIADAAFVPLLIRLVTIVKVRAKTIPPDVAEEAEKAFASPRFARIFKYLEENKKRPSFAKTWDEAAVIKVSQQRVERIFKTGKVNHEVTIPVPGAN